MTETSTSLNPWGQLLKTAKRKVAFGEKFNRLTVISHIGCYDQFKGLNWHCRCDCGGETVTRGAMLLNGKSKSCGCLRMELTLERFAKQREYRALNPLQRDVAGHYLPRHNRDTKQKDANHG